MKRGKQYPQKVLWVKMDEGAKTQQGNPRGYWYLLGCGHVQFEFYKAGAFFDYMLVMKPEMGNPYISKNCRNCGTNRKPDDKPSEQYPLGFVREVFGTAGDRILEIHRESGLLRDALPHDAHFNREDRIFKHLDQVVVREHNRTAYREQNVPIQFLYSRSPFSHQHMHVYWELENGYVVGWNENPSRGWSFHVKKIPEDYRSPIE